MRKVGIVMGMKSFVAAACGIVSAASLSAECWQYVAAGAGDSATWPPVKGGLALVPFHGGSNGWASAVHAVAVSAVGRARFAASFNFPTNGIASPLAFAGAASQEVAHVFVVTRVAALDGFLPTLIDMSPRDLRLRRDRDSGAWAFEGSPNCRVSVNGVDTDAFGVSPKFQLVEIDFEPAVGAGGLRLFNSAGRPEWKRNWRGDVGEVVACTEAPTRAQRQCLLNYFHAKWGVPAAFDVRGVNVIGELKAMGVDHGGVFATLVIVR